jgi:hypothetical protein
MAEAYGIRTDLNMPQAKVKRMVAKNQTWGKASEQLASQRMVPMGAPPTEVQARTQQPKREIKPLGRPTERPNEPITAGAPFGPGIGPVAAGIPTYSPTSAAVEELKMLAQLEQNTDLADLASRWMS